MTERDYPSNAYDENFDKVTEKMKYWESILGKAKTARLAEENEKIRFHLKEAPYTVLEQEGQPIDIKKVGWSQKEVGLLDSPEDEKSIFAPFYELFLRRAISKYRGKKAAGTIRHAKKVEQDFVQYTLSCLQKISLRTLILEMHQLKAKDKLSGNDEAEEYQDFLYTYLHDTSYIRLLYERYPILFRMMEEQTGQCLDYFCEIIDHLETDKEEIEKRFLEGSVFELSSIRCMFGDAHHRGRSVACVSLNGTAEIIYKPHSLENECIFQNLLKKISKKCSLWNDNMGLKMLGRMDYGWEEKICFRECSTETEIKMFYERSGTLLFIAYILGTNDLHCENMIAKGAAPVLIDLETLIHLQKQGTESDGISGSVLASGILPTYLPNDRGNGNDVSALSGEGGKKGKMRVPVIRDAYSSKMRIEYRSGIMGHAQNRAKYQGRPVETAKYLKDLIRGFEKAYEYVKDNSEIQNDILNQVEGCKSRQLVSDTMKYAALLGSSYHPDLLTDGGDRELFVRSIGIIGKTREQRLVECEATSMLRGDIPCFSNEGRHLVCENKICIPDYFTYTPHQAVQNRITRLSQRDEQFQVKLIELSVAIAQKFGKNMINSGRKRKEVQRDAVGSKISEDVILSTCEKIAELILDNVYEDEDGKLQILSIDMLEQSRSKIRRVSQYFYEGTAGIALFLHALESEKTRLQKNVPDKEGRTRTGKKVAERLLEQLKEYTENFGGSGADPAAQSEGLGRTGMFDGEFSIVYVYLLLYEIGKEERYLRLAKLHTQNILPLLQKDESFDLLGGNAGGITVLLKLYDMTGDENYLTAASAAGDILCSRAVKMGHGIGWPGSGETPLCGMAHGNSGILTALARLYQKTGSRRFYDACWKCLDYEDSLYAEEFHDWKDLREEAARSGHEDGHEMSWCHGAGGIALSRLLAAEAFSKAAEEEWSEKTEGNVSRSIEGANKKAGEEAERIRKRLEGDIKRCVPGLEEHALRQGMCICHGTIGNYRILKKLRRVLDGRVTDRIQSEVYEQILCWEKREMDLLVQEYHSPGFMNGLAGIGYYLLKEIDEGLPDILEL